MENQEQHPSAISNFIKGVRKSIPTTLIAAACVYGVMLVLGIATGGAAAGLLPFVAAKFSELGLSIATTMIALPIFSGLMSVLHGHNAAREAQAHGTAHSGHTHSPDMAPVIVPTIAADRAEGADMPERRTDWAARNGGAQGTGRIEQILANGALSDKDRASAILAEREAAASASAQRA